MGSVISAKAAAGASLVATVVVVAVKLVAAAKSGSVSVLSEALQSIVDVAVSGMAILTLRYVERPPDSDHPYGHGKAELLAGGIQMLVVMASSGFIIWQAVVRFGAPQEIQWNWGAWAMAYTLVSNTAMSAWLKKIGKQVGSTVLTSEAVHLKGDSLASAGVLVGMVAVGVSGWLWLDPTMAIVFAVLALASAVRQLQGIAHPLMDGGLPEGEILRLKSVLLEHPEVRSYHDLKTRETGGVRQVELHITLDDQLSFVGAHELAEEVESALSRELGGARVVVHYEPHEAEMEHQRREHSQTG